MIPGYAPPNSSEILNIPGETGITEIIWVFDKNLTMFGNLKGYLYSHEKQVSTFNFITGPSEVIKIVWRDIKLKVSWSLQ